MGLQEAISKLRASRNLLQAKLQRIDSEEIQFEPVEVIYKRYAAMRLMLQDEYPTLFDDLPDHPVPKGTNRSIAKFHVWQLMENIDYCLDLLSTLNSSAGPITSVTREGVFFTGQFFDALLSITNLITQAQKNIVIIDNYINEEVLKLLTAKGTGVMASILTKSVEPALVTSAKAFDKQYSGLQIRLSRAFHDRFVFIDERDFFHFGASLKDLGNRGFMFSRIEEPFVMRSLLSEFNKEWANSPDAM